MEYVWDEAKNEDNIGKHGVSFTEAARAFDDAQAISIPDEKHSQYEPRWWLMGKVNGRVITVRYTCPKEDTIRIFGAGHWRKGTKTYEKLNT
ncbi:MAG: BrnT family toxin [Verrucomicrobiales bacterium]|jgi:uncharacterized DUF497 family protein|nr:BrnT family toxin [Verrucomicrobiales bacterium]